MDEHTCVCISSAQGEDVADRKWALGVSYEAGAQLPMSVAAECVQQTCGGHEGQGVMPETHEEKCICLSEDRQRPTDVLVNSYRPQAIWDTSVPISSITRRGRGSLCVESWPSCPLEPFPNVNRPPS